MGNQLEIRDVCEAFFENAAEGLIVVCRDGIIRMTNPRIEEMFGYERGYLPGKKVEVLVPDIYKKRHVAEREKYSRHPEKRPMGINRDLFGKRRDGGTFPLEVSLNHLEVRGETVIMALVSDITERKRSEEHTRFYASIARHIQVGIVIFRLEKNNDDRTLRIIAFNPAAEHYTGLKEADIVNHYIDEVFPEARSLELPRAFARIAGSEGRESSKDFLYKDKRVPDKAWSLKMFSLPGNAVGVSFEDISVRKNAEDKLVEWNKKLKQRVEEKTRALRESQRLYKLIARNFPNGAISVLNRQLRYIFVEGMEMYKRGMTGDTLMGTGFLKNIKPAEREKVHKRLMAVFEGQNTSFELEMENRVYMVNCVGLHDNNHQVGQILLVSQNITSLKEAEENVQQALAKEKQLNELKSRFVSMASHEFRTPLTAVMNSVSLLSRYLGNSDEKQQRQLVRIRSSVHHLTNILNDFLSIDKLEDGKVEFHPSVFELPDFTEGVMEENILKEKQQISYRHQGRREVCLDKQMLKIVFSNLLSNAIKYSSEGSDITLCTSVENGVLTLSVKDEGIGISKEEQIHLFERFFRAKNAMHLQGTGLGLNIVKKYVEMAGGKIDFESESGKGTRFTVEIPLTT